MAHSGEDQVLYPPLSSANEIVTAAAVSMSGQFLAVGTSGGAFGQYVKPSVAVVTALNERPEGMKSTELYRINEVHIDLRSCMANVAHMYAE